MSDLPKLPFIFAGICLALSPWSDVAWYAFGAGLIWCNVTLISKIVK